jgi:UPF0755 protein
VSRDRERRARPPREHHAPAGRTLIWLGLLLVLVIVGGIAAFGGRLTGGDDAAGGATQGQAEATGSGPVTQVLFREGLRREEMARVLQRETGLSARRYLELTAPSRRGQLLARTTRPTSLEGFLFPATYPVAEGDSVEDVVDAQVEAFRQYTADIDYSYARRRNLTRFDVLILASMIEREASDSRERRIIAGVMYNRLRAGMRLDIDATVQYALGEWKPELTASDLDIDSPYNTRKFPGLPPGPICNPGEDSIRAAARPIATDFLYYVARADGTDRHYFARTPAEFEQAVARARANAGG